MKKGDVTEEVFDDNGRGLLGADASAAREHPRRLPRHHQDGPAGRLPPAPAVRSRTQGKTQDRYFRVWCNGRTRRVAVAESSCMHQYTRSWG